MVQQASDCLGVVDEAAVVLGIIEALRRDDGRLLRAFLKRLREGTDAESHLLAEALRSHPRLRDLVPH